MLQRTYQSPSVIIYNVKKTPKQSYIYTKNHKFIDVYSSLQKNDVKECCLCTIKVEFKNISEMVFS